MFGHKGAQAHISLTDVMAQDNFIFGDTSKVYPFRTSVF
jgi:hypothetical protein